jgi:hypothetical protein
MQEWFESHSPPLIKITNDRIEFPAAYAAKRGPPFKTEREGHPRGFYCVTSAPPAETSGGAIFDRYFIDIFSGLQ